MEYSGYRIVGLGTYPMFEVKARGQGQIPEALKGQYTTTTFAKKAIDAYLESLKKGKRHEQKESAT